MKKNLRKWLCVVLAVGLLISSLPLIAGAIPSPSTSSVSGGQGQSPLRVEITSNRARYTLLGRMQFTATITNVSDSPVENISAEALFGADLQPLARNSTFTIERESLAPNESFSFTYYARLSGLRSLDNLLLPLHWIGSMVHGGTANLDDNEFNDGRLFLQTRLDPTLISLFSGRYNGFTVVTVYVGEPVYNPFAQTRLEHISVSEYGWEYVDNQLLIHAVREIPRAEMETIAERINARIVEHMPFSNIFIVEFPTRKSVSELETYIAYLEELPQVRFAHINYSSAFEEADFEAFVPNDPWHINPEFSADWNTSEPSGNNWGVEKISAPYAWAHREQLQPVTVGVIDSKIDFEHEDLEGWTVNPTLANPAEHGTHIAGTIGATFNNGIGISGVAPNAELLGFNANDPNLRLRANADTHIRALELLFNEGSSVINFSRTTQAHNHIFAASRGSIRARNFIYRYANEISNYLRGILSVGHEFLIVTAAGNTNNMEFSSLNLFGFGNMLFMSGGSGNVNSRYTSFFNAITDNEIRNRILVVGSIGGAENDFWQSDFSNRNPDIFAPGEMIFSTLPNNAYGREWERDGSMRWASGTSMAAPHVSGVAAMVWGADPSLRGDEVRNIILNNATRLPTDNTVNVVNARRSVNYALGIVDDDYDGNDGGDLDVQPPPDNGTTTTNPPDNGTNNVSVGGTFTDNAGIEWRVLYIDGQGRRLIITEHVYGTFAPHDDFQGIRYHAFDEFVQLIDSNIHWRLSSFWNQMGADMRAVAIPVNLGADFRSGVGNWPVASSTEMFPQNNIGLGFSNPTNGTANDDNSLFILSLAEASYYFGRSATLGQFDTARIGRCRTGTARAWWLRSPGSGEMVPRYTATVAIVLTTGARSSAFNAALTPTNRGFRPALWVSA